MGISYEKQQRAHSKATGLPLMAFGWEDSKGRFASYGPVSQAMLDAMQETWQRMLPIDLAEKDAMPK